MVTKEWAGLVLGLLLTSAAAAQTVHKWVDEQGRVHYGSQPPASARTEQVKVQPNGGGSPGARRAPAEVKAMEQGLAQGFAKTQAGAALSCDKAVSSVREQLDTMLEVGQKNHRDGYLSAAEFEGTAAKIRETKAKISLGDCQAASGVKKDFYACMSHSSNHLIGCAQKHRF